MRTALLVLCVVAALLACDTAGNEIVQVVACDRLGLAASGDAFDAADVAVNVETGGDPLLVPVAADVSSYLGRLWNGTFPATDAPPDFSKKLTIWISTSQDARGQAGFTALDGYAIVRQDPPKQTRILVVANDAKNLAFGAYALLEELGVRFFHPLDEVVPALPRPYVPHAIHVTRAPAWRQRGLQLHTLHPIEYFHVFNEPSDEHLAQAKRFVDWLVKTGQNYFQWVELATVDFATWKPYAQSIVDYAHARGVKVGAVVQVWGGASLQNNYVLVTSTDGWQQQMDAALDRIMQISWDTLALALGEFVSADPQMVIDWMNHATDHLLTAFPSLEVDVQNHVGNYSNLYVQYQGQTVYYYHLPQFADPRLGQSVHTLSLFDLYRDWATYAHPDFHFQHDYILQELPTRRVSYFPESAYWISADDDVPQFLPEFLQARWNDVSGLVTDTAGLPALEGHIMFSSGHEWNYWLTDYLTAKMMWEPTQPLSYFVNHYAEAFGTCSSDIGSAVSSLIDLQNHYLFDERLLPYVQGENATVDEGYLLGYETHPKRVAFEDVLAMGSDERRAFAENVVSEVEAYAAAVEPLEDAVAARCRGMSSAADASRFCAELWDGFEIDRLRASQSAALYRAILDLASGGDGKADLARAQQYTGIAGQVVARREPFYRFPLHDLVDAYPNATAYPFGYLRTAHTLCYWTRQEMQVETLMQTGEPATVYSLPGCTN